MQVELQISVAVSELYMLYTILMVVTAPLGNAHSKRGTNHRWPSVQYGAEGRHVQCMQQRSLLPSRVRY